MYTLSCFFRNKYWTNKKSYHVTKPRLLKSRDFGRLIRAPNHWLETNDSQSFFEASWILKD